MPGKNAERQEVLGQLLTAAGLPENAAECIGRLFQVDYMMFDIEGEPEEDATPGTILGKIEGLFFFGGPKAADVELWIVSSAINSPGTDILNGSYKIRGPLFRPQDGWLLMETSRGACAEPPCTFKLLS